MENYLPDRPYQSILLAAKPERETIQSWKGLPELRRIAAQLKRATENCSHPEALKKLEAIEMREFAINSEQAQNRFTLSNQTRESILIKGPDGVNIHCKPSSAETSNPEEIRKCLNSEIELLQEIAQKGEWQDPLTEELIKGWHKRLTKHQSNLRDEYKGRYKPFQNHKEYPRHYTQYFCKPEHAEKEMRFFLRINETLNVPAEFCAPWQAYALHRIHPFVDGNSRTSRIAAACKLVEAGLLPVSLHESQNQRLLDAYAAGNAGDLLPITILMQNKLEKSMRTRIWAIQDWQQGRDTVIQREGIQNMVRISPTGEVKIEKAKENPNLQATRDSGI